MGRGEDHLPPHPGVAVKPPASAPPPGLAPCGEAGLAGRDPLSVSVPRAGSSLRRAARCCVSWTPLWLQLAGLPVPCAASLVAEPRLQSAWAQPVALVACGVFVPRSEIEPASPVLDGGFLTRRPPGTSPKLCHVSREHVFSSAQWFGRVRLFATAWTAARQASLSITNSRS